MEAGSLTSVQVNPSTEIKFAPCFDGFECARLNVPLDYTGKSANKGYTQLALISLPAAIPVTDPHYLGPLLMNPGGPGVSGVDTLLSIGPTMHQLVGTNHTLISFDPRGVNNTTPSLSCFDTADAYSTWFDIGSSGGLTKQNIPYEIARYESLWANCDLEIQKYVSTQNVARDMLEISEKTWKLAGKDGSKKGLRFWGISYGTALGQTFAQMFPERVDRMLLDAVVDVIDYSSGALHNVFKDQDKLIGRFFDLCSEAGPETCPFAAETKTGKDVKRKFDKLLKDLDAQPLPVLKSAGPEADSGRPDVVTSADALRLIRALTYSPLSGFPMLGGALEQAVQGDGSSIAGFVHQAWRAPYQNGSCSNEIPAAGNEAIAAIYCSTTAIVPTQSQIRKSLEVFTKQSKYAGGEWALTAGGCAGWKQPTLGLPKVEIFGTVTTKNPILFVSTGLDPATPLANARAAAKLWRGSGVLSAPDGMGHGFWAVDSKCMQAAIAKFWIDGKVDSEKETKCVVDSQPFDAPAQE